MKRNRPLFKHLHSLLAIASFSLLPFASSSFADSESKPAAENNMTTSIQFYRNATMKINYTGKTILTDPMLAEKGTLPGYLPPNKLVNPTSALTVSKEEIISGADFLLLSHTHIAPNYKEGDLPSDHMDPVALKLIDKNFPTYLQPFDEEGMKNQGFKNLTVIEKEITVGNIKIQRFDGVHVDDESLLPMIGESSGYILSAPNSPTILWAGDTLLTDDIKTLISKTQPDVIILHPGGAWLPKDDKGNKATLLMGVDETIEVAKLAPKAKIIAIHVEALDHCPVTRKDLQDAARENKISKDRFITPANGEVINL